MITLVVFKNYLPEWPSSKKSTNNKCWRGCGDKGALLLQSLGCKLVTATIEDTVKPPSAMQLRMRLQCSLTPYTEINSK